MKWADEEIQAEVFVWEAAAEIAVETTDEEVVALKPVVLRSLALEALDVVAEQAPAQETSAAAVATLQLKPEGETEDLQPVRVDAVAVASDVEPAELLKTDVNQAVEASANPDQAYMAECLALFHEIFPGGLETIFAKGVSEGIFSFLWGNGPVSGQSSWTNADDMVLDAFNRLIEDADLELADYWQDFFDTMVERLFPDGVDIQNLHTGMFEKGPISGQAEWTLLDYRAYEVVQARLWYDHLITQANITPLEAFNDAYPEGILELFPGGYSDEAMQALIDGKGLVSGADEWTEADNTVFRGLLDALQGSGIEPFASDTEYTPMPIVMDDRDWFLGQPDEPILVVCDFLPPELVICDFPTADPQLCDCLPPLERADCNLTPPPEPVVCTFSNEDMVTI
jgi:hypothetical protein